MMIAGTAALLYARDLARGYIMGSLGGLVIGAACGLSAVGIGKSAGRSSRPIPALWRDDLRPDRRDRRIVRPVCRLVSRLHRQHARMIAARAAKTDSILGRKLSVGAAPTRKGAGGLVNPGRLATNRPTRHSPPKVASHGSIVTISRQRVTFSTGIRTIPLATRRVPGSSFCRMVEEPISLHRALAARDMSPATVPQVTLRPPRTQPHPHSLWPHGFRRGMARLRAGFPG